MGVTQQHGRMSCSLYLSTFKQLKGHSLINRGCPHTTTGQLETPVQFYIWTWMDNPQGGSGDRWALSGPPEALCIHVSALLVGVPIVLLMHWGWESTSAKLKEQMRADLSSYVTAFPFDWRAQSAATVPGSGPGSDSMEKPHPQSTVACTTIRSGGGRSMCMGEWFPGWCDVHSTTAALRVGAHLGMTEGAGGIIPEPRLDRCPVQWESPQCHCAPREWPRLRLCEEDPLTNHSGWCNPKKRQQQIYMPRWMLSQLVQAPIVPHNFQQWGGIRNTAPAYPQWWQVESATWYYQKSPSKRWVHQTPS